MSIYGRRMFRMANGGGLPPDPAMMAGAPMDPAMMAAPPMDPAMMPPAMPDQVPPELLMAAEDMVDEEMMGGIHQATAEGLEDINMAGDYRELMNAVWEEDAPADLYRQRLADVVGPEDAAQTPDSVLALVQPTLLMAQLDEGIGALMQEELSEVSPGVTGEGIATLGSEAPVAESMATQTGALVDAIGGMSDPQMPMDPMMMDPTMMAAMEEEALTAPGPYPV